MRNYGVACGVFLPAQGRRALAIGAVASFLAVTALLAPGAGCAAETATDVPGVELTHDGIGAVYAKAIARTVASARLAAMDEFGFSMPDRVNVTVRLDKNGKQTLFTDGSDHVTLVISSERQLLKPATSGIFNVYGFCHEVGHIAMYRLIPRHDWMTTAAAEGWAHYLGSRLLDSVHEKEGPALWPDSYDYLADGTQRLRRQLAARSTEEVARGAGKWQELAGLVGDKALAKLFKVWGSTSIAPTAPAVALKEALLATFAGNQRVGPWWAGAEPLFVQTRKQSRFASRSVDPKSLAGRPQELKHDDGVPKGKSSFAGGGHAVRFAAPGSGYVLTRVQVYGSRYGSAQPPAEDFHICVCDKDGGVIVDSPFPYSRFQRGVEQWVTLDLNPMEVPAEFLVCVSFNPTATRGVFVFHDRETASRSLSGLPENGFEPFTSGNWLIRASVDKPR